MIMSDDLIDKEAKRQSRTSLAGWIDTERYRFCFAKYAVVHFVEPYFAFLK